MKIDLRIVHTKKRIKDEFINLLNEYPLNKITVKTLCDKAEINRATFYRYYEDIYDLYEKIKSDFIVEFLSDFHKETDLSTDDKLKIFLHEIKNNSDIICAVVTQKDAINFAKIICDKIYCHIEEKFNALFADFNKEQCHSAFVYTVSGCAGILGEWINKKMQTDVDSIASLLNKLIYNTLNLNQSTFS